MNLDFFFYLGEGVCAQVTAYNELRYVKDCTSVSYGLHNQISDSICFPLELIHQKLQAFRYGERLYLALPQIIVHSFTVHLDFKFYIDYRTV